MRKLHVLFVIMTLVLTVACGDKKKGGGSGLREFNALSGQQPVPSNYTGTINVQSNTIDVGGTRFYPLPAGQQYGQYGSQYQTSQNIIDPQSYQALNYLYQQLGIGGQNMLGRQTTYRIRFPGFVMRNGNQRSLVITGQVQPY